MAPEVVKGKQFILITRSGLPGPELVRRGRVGSVPTADLIEHKGDVRVKGI